MRVDPTISLKLPTYGGRPPIIDSDQRSADLRCATHSAGAQRDGGVESVKNFTYNEVLAYPSSFFQ